MRYENMTKRILSLVLAVAMLVSFLPAVQWVVEAEASEIATVASDRSTKYLSSSTGGSAYLGYGNSANKPEKVSASNLPSKIKSYLDQGYNVMLKRGDIWYLPTGSLSLKDITGTEDSPVVLGAYGDESLAMPTIAYMKKIENTAWTVVDSANNIYKANVSSMTERDETGIRVYRLFVNNEAYTHYVSSDYTTVKPSDLPKGQYYDYDGTLYVRTNGGAPTNVEVTPYVNAAVRLSIKNTSYLTIENIHFKGSNVTRPMIQLTAPTSHVKLDHCDITHCNYYVLQIIAGSDTAEINYKPEISNCYIDACFSEGEGAKNNDGLWNVGITEGITMREGVDGAWIHHNTIRNMSHAFIAIESLDRETYYNTTGVRNCIIEDNILEGANAKYARAFNICGGFNQSGVQMCYNNIYRRNKCYDMTTSSHLYGENNLIYSNLFSYVHCNYDENGKLFDGKGAQPWGFDSVPWNDHTSVGNMVINNTFYDMGGGIVLDDSAFPESRMHDNIYANNLIINYNNENQDYSGGIYDGTSGMNYVMNNGIYSAGRNEDYYVNGTAYRGESVNQVVGYRGNLSGDPKFATADLSVTGFGKRQTFDLSSESPYCYAGLALKADVYSKFPMYAKLLSDYTDINGNPYNPDAPSVGAYSYGASTGSKANIMEVTSAIPAVSIVPKYKEYWGNSWKEALGNEDIQVKTSDGKTATVAVDWDYTPLGDLSIFGKYTITGKLVSNVYNNPNNITVQRTVYIQEETGNLMHNGTFDKDYSSWYCGQNPVVTNGIMQLTLKSTTSHQWNVMYSRGYNSSSTTGNWAKTLADNVAKVGAGQYYLGFDSKWVTVMQDISSLGIYLQLDGYNTYNQSITTNLMKGEVKNNMQASNSGKWETVSNIVDLSGEDAFLRASVIVYHSDAKFTGQVIQLDNLKLFPLKINLNLPANLQQPTFSSVTAAKDGSNMNLTFKVPASSFGTTFTNPYVMVNYKGQNYKITSYTVSNNQYVFSFTDKAAYPLDTAVTATLCYTYGNNVISSEPYAYYAKDYCKENGHDYKVIQSTKPTCTEPGKTSYVCAACGDSYTQTVSATGHTSAAAVRENEITATCIGSGSYEAVVYCSVCSLELSRKTVTTAATGVHTYDNSADIDCNVCGAVREKASIVSITSKLPALGVVVNYDSYVADWETGLGLASQATVILSNGTETTVDIFWDYSTLNLKKLGKYKVVGEVISAQYSNPKNLTVEQTVCVMDAVNLIFNPSIKENGTGWGSAVRSGDYSSDGDGYSLRKTYKTTSASTNMAYQNNHKSDPETTANYAVMLANAMKAVGNGQYYFSFDAKSDAETLPAGVTFGVKVLYKNAYSDSSYVTLSSKVVNLPLVSEPFATSTFVFDYSGQNWVRTDLTAYSANYKDTALEHKEIFVYLDNIQLIPLRVELAKVPVDIVSVETETAPLQIVAGYDKYVGADWQAQLGLLAEATVTAADGNTATATIEWDYAPLGDLTTPGKYVIEGKLSCAEYTNYNNVTIKQTIVIAEKTNLFVNGDFEDVTNPIKGWYIPGLYTRYTAEFARGTGYAAWIRGSDVTTTSRTAYNSEGEESTTKVAERVTALGAGQYYFSAYGRVGNAEIPVSFQTQFFYRYGDQTSTPSGQKPTGNKLDALTTEYQSSGGVVELPAGITFAQVQIKFSKSDLTVSFEDIGTYMDDVELIPLKVAYVEPAECAHEWDEGVVDPAATCTKDGVITYTCTLCNETKTDVIPATGEHAWDEGVIKPDATCTEAGVKTYTCGTCGETKTEAVSALGHTKAEPVIENEKAPTCVEAGSYDSVIYCSVCKVELSRETIPGDPATGEHTYEDGKCTECGAEEPVVGPILDTNLSLALKALVLDSYIGAQFIVNPKVTGYDNIYITVSADGAEPIAYTETIDSRYYAYTHGVAPKNMNVEMEIIVYGEKDGKLYAGVPETWSVKGGIVEMLDKYYKDRNSDVKMMQRCVLLVDMLYYGAAAQTRFGATAHGLATDDLNPDYAALRTVVDAELTVDNTTVSNEGDQLALYSLGLEDQVDLQFIFKLAVKDQSLYTIKVTYGDKVKVYGPEDFAETSSSYAAVVFSELGANAMRDTVSVALFKGETQVSETYVASIAGTAKALIEKGGVNVALAKAMMIYGDSAAAFLAK